MGVGGGGKVRLDKEDNFEIKDGKKNLKKITSGKGQAATEMKQS
jgi:hypothetical protein